MSDRDLPDPPVPTDADLREFGFTPMFRARLFGSTFHARVTDSEWRAGVTLWLKSWDQVPAGSLPSDDIELARLGEFARDMKAWKKVKAGALHGWFLCSDGRLYHKVVAEGVLDAWLRRRKASDKGKAGAAARWHSGNGVASESDASANATATHSDSTGMPQALARAMPGDSKGQDRDRTGIGNNPQPPSRGPPGASAPTEKRPRALRDRSLVAWHATVRAIDEVNGDDGLTWQTVTDRMRDPFAEEAITELGGHQKIALRTKFTVGELQRRFRYSYEQRVMSEPGSLEVGGGEKGLEGSHA